MFNTISSKYDKANRFISLGLDQHWRKTLLKSMPEHKLIHLLDLATGTGDQMISLLENHESIVKATGLDLARQMMDIGKKKIEDKPYRHKVSFVHGDAQKLPFEENKYECITMSFGIRNVESPLKCLKECYRVLTPKGRLLILEMSIPKNKFIKKLHLFHLRKLLPNIGGFIAKNRKAYKYLNETTETFSYGNEFLELLDEAGFQNIKATPLTFGAVTLYSGDKLG